jgi:hypothetical protein
MRRVTKPGGRVAAMENDSSLFDSIRRVPHSSPLAGLHGPIKRTSAAMRWWGDACFRLFREAGFIDIELSIQPEVHWFGFAGISGLD